MADDSNTLASSTAPSTRPGVVQPPGDRDGESNPSATLGPDMDMEPDEQEMVDEEEPSGGTATLPHIRPLVDAQGRTLNPRSCVTCRKRKVKCDKVHPCANCNRAHIACVFPSPGRAPRKVRKVGESRDKDLLDRLRRLEGVVKGLGVEVPEQEDGDGVEHQHRTSDAAKSMDSPSLQALDATRAQSDSDERHWEKTRRIDDERKGRFENRFGRLVIDEGRSRYINNSFWASLSNEVEDLKGILHQSSDDEDLGSPSSNPGTASNHQGWAFGYSSQSVDMLSLHPLPAQVELYWGTYVDRVDPLCKILHIPTLRPTVLRAASHLSSISKGFECLLFAIYYAATTSLSAEDCVKRFSEDKQVLLTRYRFAVEQALARANFLTTEETVVLQAFVIFLICLRRNSDARVIWTLTGLVVRIAQTIGIHRDGSHFALPPFEVEMRRRLWWQVCILDTRASEDHGCDPTIIEQSFDTEMPLNINDDDMHPDMKDFPDERQGCTDMSFCLIRFEVSNTFRRLNYIPPGPQAPNQLFATATIQSKERWITECHKRLEERYLQHCDMSVPLFWVTATVARLMMSKMWLMVYHPFQRHDAGANLSAETKEKLFITSLENVEYSLLLETEARTMKWGWLFKTYMQWHALAFMLSELCHRTTGELVERAWVALEKSRDGRWGAATMDNNKAGHLWRPLKKLYRKAKEARSRGLHEERIAKRDVSGLGKPFIERTYSPCANSTSNTADLPRVVRAPLSNAQLTRFSKGPTFGQMPLDKHELMRSPKPGETPGEGERSVDPSVMSQQNADVFSIQAGLSSLQQIKFDPTAQNPPAITPNFSHDFLNQPSSVDFGLYPPNCSAADDPSNLLSGLGVEDMRMDVMDSTNFDLEAAGIMDTSGDLDWDNWDQLVRQYGMDVDPGAEGTGGGGGADVTMGAPVFTGPAGQNLRMGMGMAGGDWF